MSKKDDSKGPPGQPPSEMTMLATIVTFGEASCANPVKWSSTATEAWRCSCCGAWMAPNQTHRCIQSYT